MAQTIPQSGGLFGRIGAGLGKGLGEGLAEQLPKEMDRSRLAKGLETIGKDSSLTPFQQAAALKRYGGDNETINTFIPLLQQQNTQQEFLRTQSAEGKTGTGSENKVVPSNKTQSNFSREMGQTQTQDTKPKLSTIVTPESSAILGEAIIPPQQAEIDAKARDYLSSQPNRFKGDVNAARAQAEKDLMIPYNTKVAEQTAAAQQIKLKDKFDEDFKNYISTQTQKGVGNYSDITGEQLNNYIAQAEDDFASKRLSKDQAIRKYGDEALDFAKKKQNLKTIGATWMVNKDSKDNLRSLEEIKKVFKTPEQKKELENLLESEWRLNPAASSYLTYGVKGNKDLNNFIVKEKKANKRYFRPIETPHIIQKRQESMNKSIKDLSKVIKPTDSPLAISQAMQEANYKPSEYFRAIQDAYNRGEISLVKDQVDEFAKQMPVNPSLDDLFYFGMLGLDELVEQR